MRGFKEKMSDLLVILRAYSFPISIMSWFVVFLYSALRQGSIFLGILALLGILFLHAATNLFDDIVDYLREKALIDKGMKDNFNFQQGKCEFLINGKYSIKQYLIIFLVLLTVPALLGMYFFSLFGIKLLYIIIPTLFLCLLYPILGCLGTGELLVALIFSPLLYLGVNLVMTGTFSFETLVISVSTGLLSVAVLHNHMLLDFNVDEKNRKITLCRICGTKKNAFFLLKSVIFAAYINIPIFCFAGVLNYIYMIVFLSMPSAIIFLKVMRRHIDFPDEKIKYNILMGSIRAAENAPENQRNFLTKFLIMRNLLNLFTLLLCIAMVLECIL